MRHTLPLSCKNVIGGTLNIFQKSYVIAHSVFGCYRKVGEMFQKRQKISVYIKQKLCRELIAGFYVIT
jgi:hypothetical protein